MPETTPLYRPVGLYEARLILEAASRCFPPRLPEQPYFYPVLHDAYAVQIARDWNTKDRCSGYAGFVTCFAVHSSYLSQFEERVVGAEDLHRELWVPADQLAAFNQAIAGTIRFTQAFYGEQYVGLPTTPTLLRVKTAAEQFLVLDALVDAYPMDFDLELLVNAVVIQLNYAYWRQQDFSSAGIDEARKAFILDRVRMVFQERPEPIPLVGVG